MPNAYRPVDRILIHQRYQARELACIPAHFDMPILQYSQSG
jgi:hypothetical protein